MRKTKNQGKAQEAYTNTKTHTLHTQKSPNTKSETTIYKQKTYKVRKNIEVNAPMKQFETTTTNTSKNTSTLPEVILGLVTPGKTPPTAR